MGAELPTITCWQSFYVRQHGRLLVDVNPIRGLIVPTLA